MTYHEFDSSVFEFWLCIEAFIHCVIKLWPRVDIVVWSYRE